MRVLYVGEELGYYDYDFDYDYDYIHVMIQRFSLKFDDYIIQ